MKKSYLLRRLFASTFITMFLVEFSNTISCVIDGLVTSRYLGSQQMAAYGIAAPYFSIASIISGILMIGGQTLCAKSLGNGDRESADKAFSTVCTAGTVLSIILAIIGVLFSDQIAMLLGARDEYLSLLPYTSQYLKGLFIGTPFFVMLAILAPIVQLDGGSKCANLSSIAVSVIDILVDLVGVLVFKGNLLVIAIATSFSYAVAVLILLSHFMKKNSGFSFSLKNYDKFMVKDIVLKGMPRGISMLCRALGPIITNAIVLRLAMTAGMTAMSVQSNVRFIVGAPACGISGAMLLLGSLYVGERDKSLLKETVGVSLKYVGIIIGSVTFLTFALSKMIASLYLPGDTELIELASAAIRWYALSLPILAINMTLASFLQACGKIRESYLMNVGSELVCVIVCIMTLSNIYGIPGVWAGFPAGQLLLLLLYTLFALLKNHKAKNHIDALLLLSEDFGVSDDNRMFVLMENMSDVMNFSIKTEEFCQSKGIDKKRSYLASLFVEELAGNVIQHGFNDNKKHLLETVVTIEGEDVILHIRDDCREFDLKKKSETWKLDPENPEKNIGIRMVLAMAKYVSYAGAMNTNSVIVKI